MTLRDLCKAPDSTQKRMVELLGEGRDNIFRLEGRADMLLFTRRSDMAAMGGFMHPIVRLPERKGG